MYEVAGGRVVPNNVFFAKVRVAGSNPVVRSKNRSSGHEFGFGLSCLAHHLPITCPSREGDPHLAQVRVTRLSLGEWETGRRPRWQRTLHHPANRSWKGCRTRDVFGSLPAPRSMKLRISAAIASPAGTAWA